jgi:hypothetical protein
MSLPFVFPEPDEGDRRASFGSTGGWGTSPEAPSESGPDVASDTASLAIASAAYLQFGIASYQVRCYHLKSNEAF